MNRTKVGGIAAVLLAGAAAGVIGGFALSGNATEAPPAHAPSAVTVVETVTKAATPAPVKPRAAATPVKTPPTVAPVTETPTPAPAKTSEAPAAPAQNDPAPVSTKSPGGSVIGDDGVPRPPRPPLTAPSPTQ